MPLMLTIFTDDGLLLKLLKVTFQLLYLPVQVVVFLLRAPSMILKGTGVLMMTLTLTYACEAVDQQTLRPCALEFLYAGCRDIDPDFAAMIDVIEKDDVQMQRVAMAMLTPDQQSQLAPALATGSCPDLREPVVEALRATATAERSSEWLQQVLTARLGADLPFDDPALKAGADAVTDRLVADAVDAMTADPEAFRVNVIAALAQRDNVLALSTLCAHD